MFNSGQVRLMRLLGHRPVGASTILWIRGPQLVGGGHYFVSSGNCKRKLECRPPINFQHGICEIVVCRAVEQP